MLKRNVAILIAGALLGAQATLAGADDQEALTITASTKYVNVAHLSKVKFVNDKGQAFTWRADTLSDAVVPLKSIAPAGFVAGETKVYVYHPIEHIAD